MARRERGFAEPPGLVPCARAEVAELADAPDSKSGSLRGVWVRFPPSALDQGSSRAARHPGFRRDYERWLREPFPAELAQCRAPIGLEAGDVRTRRGDAERERLPPVLERGVLDVHRDGAVDDVADSSRAKEVGQVAGPAAGADRPSLDLRIERLGCIPERTERAAVSEVPHACGDDAAVPRHPRHLAEA